MAKSFCDCIKRRGDQFDDVSEELIRNSVRSVRTHFNMRPFNNLVKVKLVKLAPKSIYPSSSQVYDTDETNTSFNPHPHSVTGYVFSSFEADKFSRLFDNRSKDMNLLKPNDPQGIPTGRIESHDLSKHQVVNASDDQVNPLYQADPHTLNGFPQGNKIDDTALEWGRLKEENLNQSENLKPNGNNKLNRLYNTLGNERAQEEKVRGDSVGKLETKSILKTSQHRPHAASRSESPLKVTFSKMRTIVYLASKQMN